MITSFVCTNIFSRNAKELIYFYREILEIPVLRTDSDEDDGVYFGFIKEAPSICIWDATVWNVCPSGSMSFVFECDSLENTCRNLKQKGLVFAPPKKFEWGTYELRLKDPDNNEIVIVEFLKT
ncbi:VOC family protein [Enterococcus sp. LJL90]